MVDPSDSPLRESYIEELCRLRQRRGVTPSEARTLINDRNVFGSMMVHLGDADALVSGVTQHYPDVIRPALQIIRMREGLHTVAGCYAMITRKGDIYFLADCSVNIDPTARAFGGNCALRGGNRPALRRHPPYRDALVFKLREHQTPALRQSSPGSGSAAQGRPDAGGGWRSDGRRRRFSRDAGGNVSLQHAPGAEQMYWYAPI